MEDKASNQLSDFKATVGGKQPESATSATGNPRRVITASVTVGRNGPMVLEDVNYIEEMAHFDRERIPERVVHAKGAGAFGYLEITDDITKYTCAVPFAQIGKKTRLAIRFSTVGGEVGSADTVRDPRGFAIKFYTEDGNWDLVGNNTPVFFIRDPILFPHFIHTQKRNPQTHLKDPNMFWDFISLRPETTHQVSILFSDRGIPDGYRHMNGYGSHAYKFVNAEGKITYCKFHFKTDQGIKNLDVNKAAELASTDPDYSIRDLFNAIANNKFPSWTLYIQVMTPEQAQNSPFHPFDVTKVWPHSQYPLIKVGKMVLDRNPLNYFADVEQIAFCPAHFIPGIEPSPDKMLLGRMFSYSDTHRYRLGPNYQQIPVNCPYAVRNYQRDGPMAIDNQGNAPNYFPNSFSGATNDRRARSTFVPYKVSGDVDFYDTGDEDNYSNARGLYERVMSKEERQRFADNIAGHVKDAADFIQERVVNQFSQVSKELGEKIAEGLKYHKRLQSNL